LKDPFSVDIKNFSIYEIRKKPTLEVVEEAPELLY
jgi:hypothetical protein